MSCPRIDDFRDDDLEVPEIAGNDAQIVSIRGRRDERIHNPDRSALGFLPGDDSAPGIGNLVINRQYAVLEAQWELVSEPVIEPLTSIAVREAFDPVTKLRECDYTEEHTIFIHAGKPGDDPGIGPWFHPLRDDVSVEKKAHSSVFRR